MKRLLVRLLVSPALLALGGCAVGYNTALFTTKTNVGVDVDTTPPTAEISIARREIVIAPTFEGGQTPPVIASFRYDADGIAFFKNASSTFAGGDSAVILGKLYTSDTPATGSAAANIDSSDYSSALTLGAEPTKRILGRTLRLNKRGSMQPFAFGTDSMFGLKIAWSGQTAQYPDTIKLGYHRKELALAPVTSTPVSGGVSVEMPSFFASSDTDLSATSQFSTKIGRQQYFATGKAANYLVLQKAVRAPLAARIDAAAAEVDPTIKKLVAQKQTNLDKIVTYVGDPVKGATLATLLPGTNLPASWAQGYDGKPAASLRNDLTRAYAGYVPTLVGNIP